MSWAGSIWGFAYKAAGSWKGTGKQQLLLISSGSMQFGVCNLNKRLELTCLMHSRAGLLNTVVLPQWWKLRQKELGCFYYRKVWKKRLTNLLLLTDEGKSWLIRPVCLWVVLDLASLACITFGKLSDDRLNSSENKSAERCYFNEDIAPFINGCYLFTLYPFVRIYWNCKE